MWIICENAWNASKISMESSSKNECTFSVFSKKYKMMKHVIVFTIAE
jgi:hypothetical protein